MGPLLRKNYFVSRYLYGSVTVCAAHKTWTTGFYFEDSQDSCCALARPWHIQVWVHKYISPEESLSCKIKLSIDLLVIGVEHHCHARGIVGTSKFVKCNELTGKIW